jgi:hypothetical protein
VGRRVRSLGDEPTSAPEDVGAFVAPFREDFGAAVDRFARTSSAARCSNGPCSPLKTSSEEREPGALGTRSTMSEPSSRRVPRLFWQSTQ